VYRVGVDDASQAQLDALPDQGQRAWRELRQTLEVAPWNGRPLNPAVPDGVQVWVFGARGEGIAYYLISDNQRRVEILAVRWFA
jgi:hypothetical protein